MCAKSVCTLLMDKAAMLEAINSELKDYRIDPFENGKNGKLHFSEITLCICQSVCWSVC